MFAVHLPISSRTSGQQRGRPDGRMYWGDISSRSWYRVADRYYYKRPEKKLQSTGTGLTKAHIPKILGLRNVTISAHLYGRWYRKWYSSSSSSSELTAPVGRWGQRLLSTSVCQTPVEQPLVVNIRTSLWCLQTIRQLTKVFLITQLILPELETDLSI